MGNQFEDGRFLDEIETLRFTRKGFDQITYLHIKTGLTITRHRKPKITLRERIWMIEELQRRVYANRTGRYFKEPERGRIFKPRFVTPPG